MAIRVVCGVAAMLGLVSPTIAGECRLALVLALDVSASVSDDEDWLQREGLARALVAPGVVRAFLGAEPVALFAFEWGGPSQQTAILPWRLINSADDLHLAAELLTPPRDDTPRLDYGTATGSALAFAASALKHGPDCWARTVDVSSDGETNAGIQPAAVYERAYLRGATVNALIIGASQTDEDARHDADLVAWFESEVLHGPGSFCVLAQGYQDYERAMSAKLERELELPTMAGWSSEREPGEGCCGVQLWEASAVRR